MKDLKTLASLILYDFYFIVMIMCYMRENDDERI